ncbi:MAG: homoserine O-acetyltransferase [Chitinophagaceae bacterium]|nr:homoserine O-acetyltransferase [Chitinophagaceae bacterium]
MTETFLYKQSFKLESGIALPQLHLAYTTYGQLNEIKDNVVWVFHALTANSDAAEWWPGLVGKGKLFDPAESFIICVNMPGSCYGSTGPLDNNPETGESYYHHFPFFTTRDMIRSYQLLKESLGITKIKIGAGGSMGGQQLVEWAIEEPALFETIIPLATNAFHSPWGIGFNASQRLPIEADETWKQTNPQAGLNGMKAARSLALLSYRNYQTYQLSQSETTIDKINYFKSESYQRYQGEKLANRFNAFSYYFLSKSMDAHHVGRNRINTIAALQQIKAKTLVISISSDILFPPAEQQFLAEHIPGANYKAITSDYGHDGFLLEFEQIATATREFLSITKTKKLTTQSIN